PFINRAIAGAYEPGSTFKLITANAALSQGVITPNTGITDTGTFRFGNQEFKGPDGDEGAGTLNLTRALTISNDFFFYQIGAHYPRGRAQYGDGIQQEARLFGLGAATGLPLGGEGTGFILTPDDKNNLHKTNPAAYPYEWEPGDSVQVAIGQNLVTVTPLQL